MSNETTLVNYLVKKLRAQGCHVQRLENKMSSGVPDINLCKNGKETWIEAKYIEKVRKDGVFDTKLNPMQINWSRDRVNAGGYVYLIFRLHGASGLFTFPLWKQPMILDNGKIKLNINQVGNAADFDMLWQYLMYKDLR